MKMLPKLLLALLAASFITACGEKASETAGSGGEMDAMEAATEAEISSEAAGEAAEDAAEAVEDAAAEEVTSGGGHTQADDEKIEGITMTQEELAAEAARIDKLNAEAAANF